MTLDCFSTEELEVMHADAAKFASEMFASARDWTRRMAEVPLNEEDRYADLGRMWSVVFAAGCESEELAREINAEILARRAARNA